MGKIKHFWTNYGSTTLTVVSTVCSVATPVLTAIATPKAIKACEEANAQTIPEKIKAGYKPYIPALVVGSVGIAADIASNRIDAKTISNIAALYNTAVDVYKTLTNETKKVVSEEDFKKIEEKTNEVISSKQPNPPDTVVVDTGYGDSWFKDLHSGQVFRSSANKIEGVRNCVNSIINQGEPAYLNDEWYDALGLSRIYDGDMLFWGGAKDGQCDLLELRYGSEVMDDGTTRMTTIAFRTEPRMDRRRI